MQWLKGSQDPLRTGLGQPVQLEKFDPAAHPLPQLVFVRLDHDQCTISLDSSGALLHRRGYRLETAKAPLRETLAAGILMASNWDRRSPIIDPFCGSGTIVIEAALMAGGIAPGKAGPLLLWIGKILIAAYGCSA